MTVVAIELFLEKLFTLQIRVSDIKDRGSVDRISLDIFS